MKNKIVVIISTSDAGKAQIGAMYALNALKHGWVEDVKLILFGPAQDLLLEDQGLQELIKGYQEIEESIVACKFISNRDEKNEQLRKLGVQVECVGEMISNYIHEGYVPMIW